MGKDTSVQIEDELKSSYLDYSMSVIVARALPDVRDGLKPVHRRILYAMRENGYVSAKPHRKSARVVGDVMGQYHPHGDAAIYDAMVRMAQPWSVRLPLIDGQGNFGSTDGDAPAAIRYTEARLAPAAEALLADIDAGTVDWGRNYDESLREPTILPARFPHLLVNGSSGIAVGMATSIPTHNLAEVCDATVALLRKPRATVADLLRYMGGPDFPTGGIIVNPADMAAIYETGRGSIGVRGRVAIETVKRRKSIVITEIPFQVKKKALIQRIAELINEKKLDGAVDVRDESDRDAPIRIVVDLRLAADPDKIIERLYRSTPLQSNFSVNMLALSGGRPETLSLVATLQAFIDFRREVVRRRTAHELDHILGRIRITLALLLASREIDDVIALIKAASSPAEARAALCARRWNLKGLDRYLRLIAMKDLQLEPEQAQAILDLRLHRLTSLERDAISAEMDGFANRVEELRGLLGSAERIDETIVGELRDIKKKFSDPRRTDLGGIPE